MVRWNGTNEIYFCHLVNKDKVRICIKVKIMWNVISDNGV